MIASAMWLLLLLAQTPAATEAKGVRVAAPARVTEIDAGRLKGDPTQLSWSPDAKQLYLRTTETSKGAPVHRHYVITLPDGKPQAVDAEPEWASKYWAWKSAQSAPGAPTMKIEVESERKMLRSTNAPSHAGLAGFGGDPGGGGVGGPGQGTGVNPAVGEAQMANVYRMLLRGEVIGEWVNAPIVPGLTFGWSPRELGLIAFANREGEIVLMDANGSKTKVAGTSDAILPAWSDDGSRLAFLGKTGRRKFDVLVSEVQR